MLTLDHKLGIFTPSTGKNGNLITRDGLVDRLDLVAHKFTGLFGGATSFNGIGHYAADIEVIREDCILQLAWATQEAYNDHYDYILAWTSYLAKEWYQETIAVLDNKFNLHLISSNDYSKEWRYPIVPPAVYIETLGLDNGLAYYENGYTISAAQYEHNLGHNPPVIEPKFYDPQEAKE